MPTLITLLFLYRIPSNFHSLFLIIRFMECRRVFYMLPRTPSKGVMMGEIYILKFNQPYNLFEAEYKNTSDIPCIYSVAFIKKYKGVKELSVLQNRNGNRSR